MIEGVISDDENSKDFQTQLLQQLKENYAQKRMRSAFMRGTEEVRDNNNSWLWMKKGYLKKETEGLIMAAQDQSFQTRWVKHYIDRTSDSTKCRMCGKINENLSHLVSQCNELAQNEYKNIRHDKVTALLHWCKTYGFETHEEYYKHFVEKEMRVLENDRVKILWYLLRQTETKIDHNKPDLILLKK